MISDAAFSNAQFKKIKLCLLKIDLCLNLSFHKLYFLMYCYCTNTYCYTAIKINSNNLMQVVQNYIAIVFGQLNCTLVKKVI